MIGQITQLVIVLFIMIMAIYYKVNIFEILMDENRKLSSGRVGMMICVWLFVWTVKRSIDIPLDNVNMALILMVGLLAFFPKLAQKVIEKYLSNNKKVQK